MLKIYLSGNMSPNPSVYFEWIENFQRNIALRDKYILSTATYESDSKFIVRHDLARLTKCDILVVNLGVTNLEHHLTGAVIEIYEAYKQNKPVYAFVSNNLVPSSQSLSPWIDEFITFKFDSEEDLVNFLLYEENI